MSRSVDRLTEVLRVGLRLRTDLDAMSTGARLGPEGQIVSISPQEKALLNHFCPNDFFARCGYDKTKLDPEAMAGAGRPHSA